MKRVLYVLALFCSLSFTMNQNHADITSFFIVLYSKNPTLAKLIEEELEQEKNRYYSITCPYCNKQLCSKLRPQVLKDNARRHMRTHHNKNDLPEDLQLHLQKLHNEFKNSH